MPKRRTKLSLRGPKNQLFFRYMRKTGIKGIMPCHWCGRVLLFDQATVDHVIPRLRGGKNELENFVIACVPCNTHRSKETSRQGNIIKLWIWQWETRIQIAEKLRGRRPMHNELKLHFINKVFIDPCIEALKKSTPVNFTTREDAVSVRDFLCNPEAITAKAAVMLVFGSKDDCKTFMQNQSCRTIYHEYSSRELNTA